MYILHTDVSFNASNTQYDTFNSIIMRNNSANNGGAIFYSIVPENTITFGEDCVFDSNYALKFGGAIFISPVIFNNVRPLFFLLFFLNIGMTVIIPSSPSPRILELD